MHPACLAALLLALAVAAAYVLAELRGRRESARRRARMDSLVRAWPDLRAGASRVVRQLRQEAGDAFTEEDLADLFEVLAGDLRAVRRASAAAAGPSRWQGRKGG